MTFFIQNDIFPSFFVFTSTSMVAVNHGGDCQIEKKSSMRVCACVRVRAYVGGWVYNYTRANLGREGDELVVLQAKLGEGRGGSELPRA
jgi:hypothetical protein